MNSRQTFMLCDRTALVDIIKDQPLYIKDTAETFMQSF